MKGKKFFLVLSAMALATGCSNDETIEVNGEDRIDFSVTAGKLTRATATTTSTIDTLKVWAFTNNQTYMDGITVTKTGSNWTYSGTKFWPKTPVDFFAVSPATPQSGTVTVNTAAKKIENYVVTDGTEDLLYAMNAEEMKDVHKNTPVSVNFRHALSQIVFKVKKTATSSIDVSVQGIKVDGVANKSTLTWATATTGSNMTGTDADTETGNTWGTWIVPTGNATYTAVNLNNAYPVTNTAEYLTSDEGNGALFLMPQTLNPWLTTDATDNTVKITGTARLLVNCKITDTASGITLWPESGDYGEVAISLSNPNNDPHKGNGNTHDRWMQGKKYIYTLIFGEGGGYDPTPDPDDPDKPEPVLVPITFTVSVDNFQNGGEYDLTANNPK